ncbi:hypothetical protein O7626_39565 [Micromonospora sp. WMMD1102]|uniref:hypothetical protein n=1 Tax=Micromonospora sp. WMMD1102 TaxID=3016105 RepID=UPI0024155DD9|nr:hypothetical protein [Micromonospora sp. WMMD1102]MDG4784338.1 hypothetical protein [Micromonospora sp. WMMD1102]MDG4784411.1 hypothetical protein [Micromonospora sp. WMMD1102]MDG4791915.1 hypothetical protein [Micromonospora sp. WMMD1102]
MIECAICQRDAGTAYACTGCGGRALRQLAAVADLTPAARAVAAGLTSRGTTVGGGGGRGRLPLDLGATARLDQTQTVLTALVREIAAERGIPVPAGADPLVTAARWLTAQLDWLRHRAPEDYLGPTQAFADISAAARVITSVVDGPGDRRWLGQCGAETDDGECRADLHARAYAATATCRACGAVVDVATRRAELGSLVRGYSYTAAEIAAAYPIRAARIRQWASRGRIVATGEHHGRPTYDLGDVLKRAALEDARRAERKADQERSQCEAVSSGAA